MSALALSVLLSLVSAVAYAGGAIVQERVAVSSPGRQYAPLRRPSWWAAVALNGLGGLLHVVALAYGPLSVVQPLGALTIVFALPMAALFVGRKAGSTAWRGAIMATVGLAGLLSLVGTAESQSLDTGQRVAAALVTGAVVVALMLAGRAAHRHPAVRSILLATASGIAFGMSSVFTKTVAVDWTGGVSAADLPSLAVIGVLATAGMLLSQASYRGAGLAAPLATLTVVNPVVAAAVGITMFGETFRYGTTGTALALSCGVVAAGGLILLTTERLAQEQPEPAGTKTAGDRAKVAAPTGLETAGELVTVARAGQAAGELVTVARAGQAAAVDHAGIVAHAGLETAGEGVTVTHAGLETAVDHAGIARAGLETALAETQVARGGTELTDSGPEAVGDRLRGSYTGLEAALASAEAARTRLKAAVERAGIAYSGLETALAGPQAVRGGREAARPGRETARAGLESVPMPRRSGSAGEPAPVPAEELLAELAGRPGAVPAPVAAPGSEEAYGDGELPLPEEPPIFHGPFYGFYGGTYVPAPVLDRHRERVRS